MIYFIIIGYFLQMVYGDIWLKNIGILMQNNVSKEVKLFIFIDIYN